eukprot:SAG31_NODE_37677_length_302_cov_0.768473_1_plen_34_part_10
MRYFEIFTAVSVVIGAIQPERVLDVIPEHGEVAR